MHTSGNLDDRILGIIEDEIKLYRGLRAAAQKERDFILAKDDAGLMTIQKEQEPQISKIQHLESQTVSLKEQWKRWSERNADLIRRSVGRLRSTMEDLASFQLETQGLAKAALAEIKRDMDALQTNRKALVGYGANKKATPRFLDFKG